MNILCGMKYGKEKGCGEGVKTFWIMYLRRNCGEGAKKYLPLWPSKNSGPPLGSTEKKCNLTLNWAHLPISLNISNSLTGICQQRVPFACRLYSDFLSSLNFGQVTSRHTDIQNTMHMSPPYIRTGGLKNWSPPFEHAKKFWSPAPQTDGSPLPVKNDSSLIILITWILLTSGGGVYALYMCNFPDTIR